MLAIVLRVVGAYTGALGVHAGFGTVGAHAQALVVMDVWCVVCVCVCGTCLWAKQPCGRVVCVGRAGVALRVCGVFVGQVVAA